MPKEPTAHQVTMPSAAKQILGGAGKNLHTHEVHVRRTDNKGYIARHDLRDKNGKAPMDGQRSEAEYSLPDKAALMAHMQQHLGDEPDDDDQEPQQ